MDFKLKVVIVLSEHYHCLSDKWKSLILVKILEKLKLKYISLYRGILKCSCDGLEGFFIKNYEEISLYIESIRIKTF